MIGELDGRIARQKKRVEKIIINREGPAEEAQALLDDMIKTRDMMKAQLASFEKDERA
jgi:hypothetical protein